MHHKGSNEGSDYLGARLGDEQRLVLVPLDPARPWAAFRRMRAWMKRTPNQGPANDGRPPRDRRRPADQEARIIPLRPRDRER